MSGIIGSAGSKSGVIGETEIDYEEGTWTPALNLSSPTYSNQNGSYTKIGDTVTLWLRLTITNHSSGTGTLNHVLSGIPFVIDTNGHLSFGIYNNNSGAEVGSGCLNDTTTFIYRSALPASPSGSNTFAQFTYKTTE